MKRFVTVGCILGVILLSGCSSQDEVPATEPVTQIAIAQIEDGEKPESMLTVDSENMTAIDTKSVDNAGNASAVNQNIITEVENEMIELGKKVNTLGYDYCYSGSYDDLRERIDREFNPIEFDGILMETNYGISVDFGRYGYEYMSGSYFFGPKQVGGGPCVPIISRAYSLSFEEFMSYDDFLSKTKSQEYDTGGDTKKITDTFEVNGYKVVVVQDRGGYPTLNITYNLVGAKNVLVIKTIGIDPYKNYKNDIESVIRSIKNI